MDAPKVFISYSHDSDAHKEWVLTLATALRKGGVDATLDQWDLSPGQDVAAFMERGIAASDRVLLICTDAYVTKATAGVGGVGYERLIVTAELVQNIDTKKFLPIVRGNNTAPPIPPFLGPRIFLDFRDDATFANRLEELLRELLGQPALAKPALGANPFAGVVPTEDRTVSTSRNANAQLLNEYWFVEQSARATERIVQHGFNGHMELSLAVHHDLSKSQIELLNAVQKAEIRTFGWPIGVVLGNRDEYRPRPTADGIRAEVAIPEKSLTGRPSYDYWAMRSNGDFYLLQSLFEDQGAGHSIYFNTRIVRIAEALLFGHKLYTTLGVPDTAQVRARFVHRGLAGRTLGSSNPNRYLTDIRHSAEDASNVELATSLSDLVLTLVQNVQKVAEPLFMLFDFQSFAPGVYTDIISKFVAGHVT